MTTELHLAHHGAIARSTYGILFLGTPHLGLDQTTSFHRLVRLFMAHSSDTSDTLQENLRYSSEMLQLQIDQYAPISMQFKSVFFYETQPASTLEGANAIVSITFSDFALV
jgi:hypothetical protein